MAQFIYGTGEGRAVLASNDPLIRAIHHSSFKALANGTSHFLRFTGEIAGEMKVTNLFISPGVPLQAIYDGTEVPDVPTELVDLFDEMLEKSGGIVLPDLSGDEAAAD